MDIKGNKSEGWIVNAQTEKVEWDENVNSQEEFEASGYDKSKYAYAGQENTLSRDPRGGAPKTYNDANGQSHKLNYVLNDVQIVSEGTLSGSLKKQRDRYWDEGNWEKAVEYHLKYATGKTSQEVSQEQGYKIMGGTVSVIGGIFTGGSLPLVEGMILGGLGIANGIDDIGSDSKGNSVLQQTFPEQANSIGTGKTLASLITGGFGIKSALNPNTTTRVTDVMGVINDTQSIVVPYLYPQQTQGDK